MVLRISTSRNHIYMSQMHTELDMIETLFIELYNSLSPNGLNVTVGGSSARPYGILPRQK